MFNTDNELKEAIRLGKSIEVYKKNEWTDLIIYRGEFFSFCRLKNGLKNQREIFESLYHEKMRDFINEGFTEDKSSRKAHMNAVKNTWIEYNKQFKQIV